MSVVDLHPEDLLDKKARGALSASESERLDAHLARCATCRTEMLLRADFADELDAPMDEDRPSLAGLLGLLEGVAADRARTKTPRDATPGGDLPVNPIHTVHVDPPPASAPNASPSSRRGGRRMSKAPAWFLVAAAMLAVSVATGATGVGKRVWTRVLSVVTTTDTRVDSRVEESAANGSTSATKRATHASAPVETSAPVENVAPPVIEPVVDVPVVTPAPAPEMSVRTAAQRVGSRASRVNAPSSVSQETEAAKLFDDAATARRQGDYGRALSLNRELLTRFPRSREAQTSRATIGRMLLDRGDPSGALASFDAYMAGGSGELGEEAMAGRATALERLGRADDARRAWEALLAAYPSTPYASHARARVEAASETAGR